MGRSTKVESLSVLTFHISVCASVGGNLYVTRFLSEYTLSRSSSPRKSCQVTYASVSFDWHRAINLIGSWLRPPTPSTASRSATRVLESSRGLALVWDIHAPSSIGGLGAGSGSGSTVGSTSAAAGSTSTFSRSSVSDAGGSGDPPPPQPAATARSKTAIRIRRISRSPFQVHAIARAASVTKVRAVTPPRSPLRDLPSFRTALHRLQLPYAVGISSHLTVFATRPRLVRPRPSRGTGRPRTRPRVALRDTPVAVRSLATQLPLAAWRRVS